MFDCRTSPRYVLSLADKLVVLIKERLLRRSSRDVVLALENFKILPTERNLSGS